MLHDFYFKRDSPWINCSSIFSPNCRPFVFSIHFGNNFWNNEHIMIRYTGYRTEHGKKRKFLIWSLFSMKIEFRNGINYNGIFHSRLFFWKFMHLINTFYSYTCNYFIRISSLKNIITRGEKFFQEESWMIDLSWFPEWATLLLSYSSIVRWNIEKKKRTREEMTARKMD